MTPDDPFERLERCFHEPKRLAMVSALLGSPDQKLSFNELKAACDLTDGNLNRHLKVLAEVRAVDVSKRKGGGRPQTFVTLTESGRSDFLAYLKSLEQVLRHAEKAARSTGADVREAPGGAQGSPA